MKIGIVCGSFHRAEVERMLEWSNDEVSKFELTVSDVVWVPGAMEVPLALDRLLCREVDRGPKELPWHRVPTPHQKQ